MAAEDNHPYRAPAAAEPSAAPPEDALGAEIGTHGPLRRGLLPYIIAGAAASAGLLVAACVAQGALGLAPGAALVALVLVVAAVAFAAGRREGAARVARHEGGLVVHRGAVRDEIVFADVDQVFFRLDTIPTGASQLSIIRGLYLVDHGGKRHAVPLGLEGADAILQAVVRRCSAPLLPDARAAIAAGETLTFGRVRLEATGVAVGTSRSTWESLKLVRLSPGRVAFCRRQTFFPWRSISLEDVPHPTVFVALVRSLARRASVDDPAVEAREG